MTPNDLLIGKFGTVTKTRMKAYCRNVRSSPMKSNSSR